METHFIVLMVQIIVLSILWILIAVRRAPITKTDGQFYTGLPDNYLLMSKYDKITNTTMVIDDTKEASSNVIWSSEKIRSFMNNIKPVTQLSGGGLSQADVLKLIEDNQQPKIYFDVSRDTSMKVPGIITYAAILASNNMAINISTGIFTCPVKGLYRMTFTALRFYFVEAPTPTRILMKRNGVQIATTASTSEVKAVNLNANPPGGECLVINILTELSVGDRIYCEIEVGGIYDTTDHHVTHFTGELMIEK